MVCRYETCDLPVLVKKVGLCSGHYQQQRRGTPLKPLRGKPEGKCDYILCNRDAQTKGLCNAHYCQKYRGEELKPLSKRWSNKGHKCAECSKDAWTRGLCTSHYYQQQKAKRYPPVPDGIDPDAMNNGKTFSTERYCKVCAQVVNWRKYHQDVNMCTKCWRQHLSEL